MNDLLKKRMNVLLLFAALAVAGFASIDLLLPRFVEYLYRLEDPERAFRIAQTALTFIFLSVIPVIFWLMSPARRKSDAQRLPPPTIHGRRSLYDPDDGRQQAMRNQTMAFIAVLLVVFAMIGLMLTRQFFRELTGH